MDWKRDAYQWSIFSIASLLNYECSLPQHFHQLRPYCLYFSKPGTVNLYGTLLFSTALTTNAGDDHPLNLVL